MNIAEYRKKFDRDGYVVIENFFDDELMDHLDGIIRDYYGNNPDFWHNDEFLEKAKTEVVPWFPQREGVQDFDSRVQQAVNRIQPYSMVEEFVGWCRELKFDSVNFDLIYGLPYQTLESMNETLSQTISLSLITADRLPLELFFELFQRIVPA